MLRLMMFWILLGPSQELAPQAPAETCDAERRSIDINDAQVQLISDVSVPARETGVLETLEVKEGDLVERGQLIGTIDRRLASVELAVARLEHDIAKLQSENDVDARYAAKSLEVAESELKRSELANRQYADSVSQTEIERLRLVVHRSSLSLEQAQRDQSVAMITESLRDRTAYLASLRLDNRRIVAPMDGMVVEVIGHREEWLNPGDPVLRVIQLDTLRVEAYLDGRKFGPELLGCEVSLAAALPPEGKLETFSGKVVFVSPELQPVTGQVRVWAEVANCDLKLRPGVHGTLTITLPNRCDAPRAQDSDARTLPE